MVSMFYELKPASSFIPMPRLPQRPLLQLCPVTKASLLSTKPEFSALHWNSEIDSGLNRISSSGSQSHLWMYAHTQGLKDQCGPSLVRLNNCLSRRPHTVPGTVLGAAAPIISVVNLLNFRCLLAHIFQLILFDYQEICITRAIPAMW